MLKPLVIVAMLTAPALADPVPGSIRVEMQVKVGSDIRSHVMNVTDGTCGRVEDKAPEHTDEIKACAHLDGTNIKLELDWMTRAGNTEYTNRSTMVLAKGGGIELGKPGTHLLVRLL
jgi:hypothetical protein